MTASSCRATSVSPRKSGRSLPSGVRALQCGRVCCRVVDHLPNKFGSFKIMLEERFFWTNFFLRKFTLPHSPSSKSTACHCQVKGYSTRGLLLSPSVGPEDTFTFHFPLVAVPSPNFRMNPPSPTFVFAYSIPVNESALSIPSQQLSLDMQAEYRQTRHYAAQTVLNPPP